MVAFWGFGESKDYSSSSIINPHFPLSQVTYQGDVPIEEIQSKALSGRVWNRREEETKGSRFSYEDQCANPCLIYLFEKCYEDDCTKEDPLPQESFQKLAMPLPFSKQHHSKLVCYITEELMDTENPPLVLPNGYVYSTKALKEMATNNNGKITCPRTGLVCNYIEVTKAFIS
ncbi:protein MAEA homolog [Helianthus annuus]|uniref:protein MAEA homolog n=1 Tax=Helianthus annuus TaxID=4232 RepID=UPI0016533C0A|nr:protein MAEA homolog [Helianthus annuus]